MTDGGTKYTDKKIAKLDKIIKEIYGNAHKEVEKKMTDFNKKFLSKNKEYYQDLQDGKITQEEYDKWFAGQSFQSQQWQAKEEQIAEVLYNSNKEATKIINGGKISVFAENANWTAYSLEHGTGLNFGFGIYDSTTVTNLLEKQPNLLPKKELNKDKDKAWNMKKISNQVAQTIIQGENIEKLSHRMADVTNQNYKAMLNHARTAYTGAQNAGRYQRLSEAKGMGIDVYKEWMATLDGRTRDSHRDMDGEKQKVGDKWHPFKFSNGLRYPGDPEGAPGEVYNCRCTLVGDIEGYPSEYERRDNIDGELIKNMSYNKWTKMKTVHQIDYSKYGGKDMVDIIKKYNYDYNEFVASSSVEEFDELMTKATNSINAQAWFDQALADKDIIEESIKIKAKEELKKWEEKQQQLEALVKSNGADKIFSGIWKDDVTYADWDAKKNSIQAKKDYYNDQMSKLSNQLANDPNAPQWVSDKLDKFIDLYTDLEEFEKHGESNSELIKQLEEAKKNVSTLKNRNVSYSKTDIDAYSQARKDAAKWYTRGTYSEGDKYYSAWAKPVHNQATRAEKDAYYGYTSASGGYNRPLAGFDYSKSGYGQGWDPNNYVGPGKVDLNREGKGGGITNLTAFIEKSITQDDIWIQSGQTNATLEGIHGFLGVDYGTLAGMSETELQQFVGKTAQFPQFISGAINRGGGIYTPGDTLLNIYVPKGSEALYVLSDGAFGKNEHELILQRGGTYRITRIYRGNDVENGGYKLIVDMELLTSMGYNKFTT